MTAVPRPSVHSLTTRRDHATQGRRLSTGFNSAEFSEPRALDIWAIAAEFPERWARLMHLVYGAEVRRICQVFGVSERAARNWINAEGGVNSRHSTIAQLDAPQAYREIILDEAA